MPDLEIVGTQIRARVADPDLFDAQSFRTKPIGDGLAIIVGKPKAGGGMRAQSYRFDAAKWTPDEATRWLDDHGISIAKSVDAGSLTLDFFAELRAMVKDLPEPTRSEILRRARAVAGGKARWRVVETQPTDEQVAAITMKTLASLDANQIDLAFGAIDLVVKAHRAVFGCDNELLLDAAARIVDVEKRECDGSIVDAVDVHRDLTRRRWSPTSFSGLFATDSRLKVVKSEEVICDDMVESVRERTIASALWIESDADPLIERITKADDDEKRLVYGVVMQPDVFDLHDDTISDDDLERSAHDYLVRSRAVKQQHSGTHRDVDVVESYIAPIDFDLGEQQIKKGAWVVVVKVNDDSLWADVKAGRVTSFSPGGMALRIPV